MKHIATIPTPVPQPPPKVQIEFEKEEFEVVLRILNHPDIGPTRHSLNMELKSCDLYKTIRDVERIYVATYGEVA